MSHRALNALLLLALLLGSALLVYTPTASAQGALVSYNIYVSGDGTVYLDVRPGASGIGCTTLTVENTGTANIDVSITLSGSGVTLAPSTISTTIATGGSRDFPVCAMALSRSEYKNVVIYIYADGKESNSQQLPVSKQTSFAAQIRQFARLSLRTDTPFIRVGPGREMPLQFIVKNDGNYIDDVAIAVTNQDKLSDAGFSVVLATNLVRVDALAEQPFTVGIQTPRSTILDWYNQYHPVTVEVRTTMAGSSESRTISTTLWVRGVFIPGFDPLFTIMALGLVATALSRKKKDE